MTLVLLIKYDTPIYSALILFIVGGNEIITKKSVSNLGLFFTLISGIVAVIYFDLKVLCLAILLIDIAFIYYTFMHLFTNFAIATASNAYNL